MATNSLFSFICSKIPRIPLPPIKVRLWDKESIEFNEDKKWIKLSDYWGDLAQLFCLEVHQPIMDFCWNKTKMYSFSMDYSKVREVFYKGSEKFWDGGESEYGSSNNKT